MPKTRRTGHTVALGVDWGLNTLLSPGAVRLHDDGRITTLGSGGMFAAAGVLAKQHRLRRLSEHLHAKADHYVVHHLKGSPLIPFVHDSSLGCAICDPVIAVWCLAGGLSPNDNLLRGRRSVTDGVRARPTAGSPG